MFNWVHIPIKMCYTPIMDSMTLMPQLEQTPDTPAWLTQTPDPQTDTANRLALRDQTFTNMFEWVIERVAEGMSLSSILKEDFRHTKFEGFSRWIHADDTRKNRYYEAQEIAAETVSAQILEIADAEDSLEDVARSTLRINSRKWLVGVWNRKRFGETKQVEQTITIDLGEAMAAAQQRVSDARTVDVEARLV